MAQLKLRSLRPVRLIVDLRPVFALIVYELSNTWWIFEHLESGELPLGALELKVALPAHSLLFLLLKQLVF
jgi:hypothetical protein